jgi:L-histidine N-alpha-methyltransferase
MRPDDPPFAVPQFVQLHHPDSAAARAELEAGLRDAPAHVSPKFLYDSLGSRLFEAITELPEYYPTRTEAAIFAHHAGAIAARIGPVGTLIDLGAGNCRKAAGLFGALRPSRYVAVDISVEFLRDALLGLAALHPHIGMRGYGIDFSHRLDLPDGAITGRPVFFYPGSSIGNFAPLDAVALLRQVRGHAAGGGLLIGVDLVKPRAVLEAAYDDALGVTAAFNLNLLRRLDRLLGSDCDPRQWRHVALYDEGHARIEMHLEAREPLAVRWPGGERQFATGERIRTEHSYKYTPQGFERLLREAGFEAVTQWHDAQDRFAVCWAEADTAAGGAV